MPARDYKQPAARKRAPARARAPRPVGWFVAGVCVGAAATWALVGRDDAAEGLRAAVGEQVDASLGRPGPNAAPTKPRFEFYTMLPEMEVAVPESELAAVAPKPAAASSNPAVEAGAATGGDAPAAAPVAGGNTYLLQVGSFRRREEAESLKAKLAFIGLEASVQTVSIDGHETWHRVRVGPYRDLGVLSEARARLSSNGYETMVLKLRG